MPLKIAAQLYTLREHTQTIDGLAGTACKLAAMGYSAVQVSAIGPIPADDVQRILADHQLICCATHTSLDRIKTDPKGLIAELRSWGCRYTAIGGYFPKIHTTADWHRFADEFNQAATVFAGTGIRLGYHNHSHELARIDGHPTVLHMLIDRLDPAIFFEIDTYWITHGGGDPAEWIRKVAGRIPAAHLKDMGIHPSREQFMMEVGEGNLNWTAILDACKFADVEWHIIEQDTCYRDPFESLAISLANLRRRAVAV